MSLSLAQRDTLRHCCRSGVENPDSDIGCYLLHPGDLHELDAFFVPLLLDVHQDAEGLWLPALAGRDVLDLATIGLPPVSMRVRVARNLRSFNLPGSMSREERLALETFMLRTLQALIDRPDYGGRIYSLTASNPNLIGREEYQALVDAHIMFKDMDADRFLKSAGLAADWPCGRACYVSRDQEVIVWVGEEDHLRIMCMKTGTRLDEVFNRLREVLDLLESLPGMGFVHDEQFGYITSCPSNLGTGMRASVHVAMPHLMKDGADVKRACERVGLSVCGTAGDHTPIGADGLLALSPTRRLFVSERAVIAKLFEGVRQLWTA